MRLACFSFLFLLFLSQNEIVKISASSKTRDPWTNKDSIIAFMQCFCQNIAKSPVFSRQEKEQVKSTMEMLVSRMRSSRHENNNIQSQTMETDFLLVIADDATNLQDASVKTDKLSQTLTLCFQTTLGVASEQFLSEIKDIIRMFVEEAEVNKEVTKVETDMFNEHDSSTTTFNSYSTIYSVLSYFISSSLYAGPTVSYAESLSSNIVPSYGTVKSAEVGLSPASISDLTNKLAKGLAKSALFRILIASDVSSAVVLQTVMRAVTRALSSQSVKSSVSFRIRNALQGVIFNLGDSANVISYAQAVASSVIAELSSSGVLTTANQSKIITSFLFLFLQATSIVATELGIVVSQNQATDDSLVSITPSTISSPSSAIDFSGKGPALEEGYDLFIFNNKKSRSIRQKRENIKIGDQDLENCATSVKFNLANESKVLALCNKIFNRGIWDEKSDEALDTDIRKLIHLLYDGKRESIMNVLYFIDNHVPQNVRELIVSYDAIIYEFEKYEDFNENVNQQYFLKIQNEIKNIKNMKREDPAANYNLAQQVHKDMLENILENLNAVSAKESIRIVYQDIKNCANAVKFSLTNQSKVLVSCRKIFNRGFWDEKADKKLDDDIRKLILLIYDSKRENVMFVLLFIREYVPKSVRELIVSYDAIIYEIENNVDFALSANFTDFQQIKEEVIAIRGMNSGNHQAEHYSFARQVHKDMLDNMVENLVAITKRESVTVRGQDIYSCANSVKFDLAIRSKVLASCRKIFNRGFWDGKADKTLDGDIRMLIQLLFDDKRINIVRVLRFIDFYVPQNVRELIVSYDTIIEEFEKNDDFNLPINQPYLLQLKGEVSIIKEMKAKLLPAANYDFARQVYKDMLENMLKNLNAVSKKESIPIQDQDIQNCANSVKSSLVNQTLVLASCRKMFNRGFWDRKADKTFDRDIRKLIQLIYDGKRENLILVLNFIHEYVPKYVREYIVSYDSIINEFEKNDDFNLPVNYPHFWKTKRNVRDIKKMNEDHPAGNYNLARQFHKDMLENMLENLNAIAERKSITIEYEDIQNCANSVKFNVVNESEIFVSCRKIFNRGYWDEKVNRTLDHDIKKLIQLCYDSGRENLFEVIYFIDKYVPKYVRDLIVSYDALVNELERNEDFAKPTNEPYVLTLYFAIKNIKNMNGESAAERYESARQTHKDMLEKLLKKFSAIKVNNSVTKESVIQNCIEAIQEETCNAKSLCNKILKEEENREWHASDVSWSESDVEQIVRGAYNSDRDNFKKVLEFVRHAFPYIEQSAKGYQVLLDEMEKNQPLAQDELNEFIENVRESFYVVGNSAAIKAVLGHLLNNLTIRFETLKEKVIQTCIKAIKGDDIFEAALKCKQILNKEDNREWVFGEDYYSADVEKIVRGAYDGDLENVDNVLNFIRNGFPYSSQDVLGYSTLLDELEKHKQLDLEILNKLLEIVKSSMASPILSDDVKHGFETIENRLALLIKDKEEEVFQVLIKGLQANHFTKEESTLWKKLYGGVNDFRMDWLTYGYVEKLIVRIYGGMSSNFDITVKAVSTFFFADQRVEGFQMLLREMEKFQHVHEESLKVLQNKLKSISLHGLSEEYKNKLEELRDRLNILLDVKEVNKEKLIQDCIESVQSQNWLQAKFKCDKLFLFQSGEIPSNELIPEGDDLELIVTTIYASNLENIDHVLKLIDIFPYIYQRLRSYSILLNEIIKKKSDYLYFSALNQFKEKITEIIHSNRFEYFSNVHKYHFKKLREDLKELIAKFITESNGYTAPKISLIHMNETIINVESISMKIAIHYDLPSYCSEYPFENELKLLYKKSEECIKDYKDFVLPQGWMSHAIEPQVDIWVFNDLDIFGNKAGFAIFYSGLDQFVYFKGMYLYRKKEDNCRVQHFKHEFMHILFVGGLGKFAFASSVPPWFHDGLSELAEHGPCSTIQLNLLRKYINDHVFRKQRTTFIGMICLRAEEQMKAYPSQWILNYFLSYFNVLYLRIRHPQFLQKIIHEAQQRGWDGTEMKSESTTSTSSARTKLCDLFHNERDIFFRWMEKSAESHSFCYSDQPNSEFKLAYVLDTTKEDGQVLSLSMISDGKLSWENLISAFTKEDRGLIDKEIELYRAILKKQITNLNLLPLSKDLKLQKSFMNTVLRFMNEIHSRRVDISIGYYYYYANAFLKLVFEDIVIPSYQRASLVKGQDSLLKGQIQSEFNEFLQKAFSKDQPPDHKFFLSWYRIRCLEVDFCNSDDLDKTENMINSLIGNVDYVGVSVPDKADNSNDTQHSSF